MSKKLRVFKLRDSKDEDLFRELEDYKKELSSLRIAKIAGGTASKLGRIKLVRKAIAKYLTVINQKNRDKVRDTLAKKNLKPLDLRGKKTRAIRKRLTKHQQQLRTLRKIKKDNNFGKRRYTLRKVE